MLTDAQLETILTSRFFDLLKSASMDLETAQGVKTFNFGLAAPNIAKALIAFNHANGRLPQNVFNDGLPPSIATQLNALPDANKIFSWRTLQDSYQGATEILSVPVFAVKVHALPGSLVQIPTLQTVGYGDASSQSLVPVRQDISSLSFNTRFYLPTATTDYYEIPISEIAFGSFKNWGILLMLQSHPSEVFASDDGFLLTPAGVEILENTLAYWTCYQGPWFRTSIYSITQSLETDVTSSFPGQDYTHWLSAQNVCVGAPALMTQKLQDLGQMWQTSGDTTHFFIMLAQWAASFYGGFTGANALNSVIGGVYSLGNFVAAAGFLNQFGLGIDPKLLSAASLTNTLLTTAGISTTFQSYTPFEQDFPPMSSTLDPSTLDLSLADLTQWDASLSLPAPDLSTVDLSALDLTQWDMSLTDPTAAVTSALADPVATADALDNLSAIPPDTIIVDTSTLAVPDLNLPGTDIAPAAVIEPDSGLVDASSGTPINNPSAYVAPVVVDTSGAPVNNPSAYVAVIDGATVADSTAALDTVPVGDSTTLADAATSTGPISFDQFASLLPYAGVVVAIAAAALSSSGSSPAPTSTGQVPATGTSGSSTQTTQVTTGVVSGGVAAGGTASSTGGGTSTSTASGTGADTVHVNTDGTVTVTHNNGTATTYPAGTSVTVNPVTGTATATSVTGANVTATGGVTSGAVVNTLTQVPATQTVTSSTSAVSPAQVTSAATALTNQATQLQSTGASTVGTAGPTPTTAVQLAPNTPTDTAVAALTAAAQALTTYAHYQTVGVASAVQSGTAGASILSAHGSKILLIGAALVGLSLITRRSH